MKICYIMVGVPGSGKSTYVQELKEFWKEKDFRVFSQDAAYFSFAASQHTGQFWSDLQSDKDIYSYCFDFMMKNQKEFKAHLEERWREALGAEVLIVDRTNLSRKVRTKYIQEARAKGFGITGVEFMVPLQVALDRQKSRSDKAVPEQVVKEMWYAHQGLLLGSEVDQIIFVDGTQSSRIEFLCE